MKAQEATVKNPQRDISESRSRHIAVSVGVGIVIGAIMGTIFYRENIALFVGLGVLIGVVYGLVGTPGNR